ncbi:MAG: hypothetical protein IJX99_02205 [Clostridia bacterium]|nr:hypothetical protein [Clostridia bacterium]
MLGKTNVKVKPNAKKPPIDYVEYIESSGTQYIDTGIIPKIDYTVEAEFQATEATGSGEGWLFATWDNSAGFRVGIVRNMFSNSNITVNANGTSVTYSQTSILQYTRVTAKATSDRAYSLYLFSQHESTGATHTSMSKYKLYLLKIYDSGGSLVRDFKPCKDENGVYCLYDEVSKTYFYNQGTGNFTGGASL